MTNKQIIDRLREAGHEVTGSPNRATLEALAAEKGVSLEEPSNSPDAPAGDAPAPSDDEEDERPRLLEAVIEYRGRKIKVSPALDGEGVQAVCEQFSSLVGFGDDEEDAVDDLFEKISLEPEPSYEGTRLITPTMAVCAIAGDAAAVAFPEVETPE